MYNPQVLFFYNVDIYRMYCVQSKSVIFLQCRYLSDVLYVAIKAFIPNFKLKKCFYVFNAFDFFFILYYALLK